MKTHTTAKLIGLALLALSGGCTSLADPSLDSDGDGHVRFALSLPDGTSISSVAWEVRSSSNAVIVSGNLSTTGSQTASLIASLPPATGDTVKMAATTSTGVACAGTSPSFDVVAGHSVSVSVTIVCGNVQATPAAGSVVVSGTVVTGDHCPTPTAWLIAPQAASAPDPIDVSVTANDPDSGETVHYLWKAAAGSFANATAPSTQYTCAGAGSQTLSVEITDDHAPTPCTTTVTFPAITCL